MTSIFQIFVIVFFYNGMTSAVADPGEGHGEPAPPLFLDQTETRSAKQIFEGLDDPPPPPPPLSQGLDRALLWSLLVRTPCVNFIIKVYR